MSKIKRVATGVIVGGIVGYTLSKFILKEDNKQSMKKASIMAAIGAVYGYFQTPEITSNASGKKSKQKDVASPKLKRYTPESWWMDSNGKYHWINKEGKRID